MVARAAPRCSSQRANNSMCVLRTENNPTRWLSHQEVKWRRSCRYASNVFPEKPARNPPSATLTSNLEVSSLSTNVADDPEFMCFSHYRVGRTNLHSSTQPQAPRERICAVMGGSLTTVWCSSGRFSSQSSIQRLGLRLFGNHRARWVPTSISFPSPPPILPHRGRCPTRLARLPPNLDLQRSRSPWTLR